MRSTFKYVGYEQISCTFLNGCNNYGTSINSISASIVYMFLLENAPFNLGKDKLYSGVSGNLVAYACKVSFQRGGEGFVAFESKTKLIDHYVKTLGAYHFGGHLMVIDTIAAKN